MQNYKKLGILAVFLVVSALMFVSPASAQLSLSETFVDFGEIVYSEGVVSTEVTVTNTNSSTLDIYRISTSCGCTSALMDMTPMAPGENRQLTITFDPSVHPGEFGPITRVVYLQTSDPYQSEIEIDVVGTVVEQTDGVDSINQTAVVFFNEACNGCAVLVKESLPVLLAEYGYETEPRDYINERENRKILNEYNETWGVPFELQSHIETFVGDKLLLGGHVPEGIIRYVLENPDVYDRLLIFQDKMHGEETEYQVWDFDGDIKTYPIDEPITTYLSEYEDGESSGESLVKRGFWGLFAIVTSSAFLDGLNPCAFAVLLFFIGFLFTIKKTRAKIWKMGIVYVGAIYLAYLLIGLGIAQAILISGAPHLMAKVGAYLVISLGIIQLLGVVFPSFPIRLRIPLDTKATLEKWLYKATLPASFIGGFLVGLCTFPCSGGIYVAIIGLLTAQSTMVQGTFWMLWYNLIFVSPLLILLAFASNRKTTDTLHKLEMKESFHVKLLIGGFMIVLGAVILIFFT